MLKKALPLVVGIVLSNLSYLTEINKVNILCQTHKEEAFRPLPNYK
jgi:hypothetical protein